jgi:hypothetical protein
VLGLSFVYAATMFDAARILALVWALAVVVRARAWIEAAVLLVLAYFFTLAVASGFTVRSEGPLEPMIALILALIGPTAMPRGALPPLPGAWLVVTWPAAVDVALCVALVARERSLAARVDTLPESSLETARLDRLGRALVLVAALEGMSAGLHVLPHMLDWGAGGSDPIFEGAPLLKPR